MNLEDQIRRFKNSQSRLLITSSKAKYEDYIIVEVGDDFCVIRDTCRKHLPRADKIIPFKEITIIQPLF